MLREVLFKRNNTPYADRETAVAAIPSLVAEHGKDGSQFHVRYTSGTVTKTILVAVAAEGCYSYYEQNGSLFDSYETKDSFPEKGESNQIYIDESTGDSYRWDGEEYVSMCGRDNLSDDDINDICV